MPRFYQIILFVFLFVSCQQHAYAQNYRTDAGIRIGFANYLGDIGGDAEDGKQDAIADMRIPMTSWSAGAYYRFALLPRVNINGSIQWGRIRGLDRISSNLWRHKRNLSFRNDIIEVAAVIEFELLERYNVGPNTIYRVDFNAYGFIGEAFFKHNPKTHFSGVINAPNGDSKIFDHWVELQPLQTEGVAYKLTGFASILGFGMMFTIDRRIKIGMRYGLRLTNTDYLDDISTFYRHPNDFDVNTIDGLVGQELSYRSDDLGYHYYYTENTRVGRGNPNEDDAYMFLTCELGYLFPGKGAKFKSKFHDGYIRRSGRRTRISRFFSF